MGLLDVLFWPVKIPMVIAEVVLEDEERARRDPRVVQEAFAELDALRLSGAIGDDEFRRREAALVARFSDDDGDETEAPA